VRDQQHRPPGDGRQQVPRQLVGSRGVQVLGRLVQDHDREVRQQDPGQGQPLALAAGEAGTVLAHLCRQPLRQGVHPGQQARTRQR
jgi:hypothetical protein